MSIQRRLSSVIFMMIALSVVAAFALPIVTAENGAALSQLRTQQTAVSKPLSVSDTHAVSVISPELASSSKTDTHSPQRNDFYANDILVGDHAN